MSFEYRRYSFLVLATCTFTTRDVACSKQESTLDTRAPETPSALSLSCSQHLTYVYLYTCMLSPAW